jgi:hypothetical protein
MLDYVWTNGHQQTNSPPPWSLLTIEIEIGPWGKNNSLAKSWIVCSFPIFKAQLGCYVKGQHIGIRVAVHLKEVVD